MQERTISTPLLLVALASVCIGWYVHQRELKRQLDLEKQPGVTYLFPDQFGQSFDFDARLIKQGDPANTTAIPQ